MTKNKQHPALHGDISDQPAIYCGTYAKYNNGSLFGAWIDLTMVDSKQDFYEICRELHKDESDPELMFQDFQGFPETFYSESDTPDELWDYLEAIKYMDEDRIEALNDYIEAGCELGNFEEAYHGKWDSEKAFAENLADELGYYKAMEAAGISTFYFDEVAFARDLFLGDYWMSENGHVFNANV